MAMKPTEPTESYSGDPLRRPTSPSPPRKKNAVDETLSFYVRQNQELLDALAGLWEYACIGASVTDVRTTEQHQFVTAARLLEPLWSKNRKASLAAKQKEQ